MKSNKDDKSGSEWLQKSIAAIRYSVFQLQVEYSNPLPGTPTSVRLGTAFAVGDEGYLITALHVVNGSKEVINSQPGELVAFFVGEHFQGPDGMKMMAPATGRGVTLIDTDEQNDLALLRLPCKLADMLININTGSVRTTIKPAPVVIDINTPKDGERVAVAGYPLNELSLVTTSGHIASSWTPDKGADRIMLDVTVNGGNSGGPVYRISNGHVIGVCVANRLAHVINGATGLPEQLMHSANLSLAVPIEPVTALLAKNNVSH